MFKVLEKYIDKNMDTKKYLCDDPWNCMYMGTVTQNGTDIFLYKHVDSRGYINIDDDGNFYVYNIDGSYSLIDKKYALELYLS